MSETNPPSTSDEGNTTDAPPVGVPLVPAAGPPMDPSLVLSVRNLSVKFGDSFAVDDVSFDLSPGETLAIVGESGSGKSVTALTILQLIEQSTRAKIAGGEILFRMPDGSVVDLVRVPERQMRAIRGNHISMVFQEPLTSLNPLHTAGKQVSEAVALHQNCSGAEAEKRTLEVFELVRIPEPKRRMKEYPHQLSGGMRQRVMIAMALACTPSILIADEPTTALDVTIQAQILWLLQDLRERTGAAVIMITHDMGVVAEVADRVLVMNRARMVEVGTVFDIFDHPQQPYTKALLAAVPRLGSMAGTTKPERFEAVQS